MTTPTQRIITATEASLDALDASLLDLQRAAAAKFGDVCAWCGGPCLCSTYSDWDDDLALALSEAAAAVICDTPPQPAPDARPVTPSTPPLAEAARPAANLCRGCGDAIPTGARQCAACSEWGDTPPYEALVM